jgi:ABC-2 type transport system permease protein
MSTTTVLARSARAEWLRIWTVRSSWWLAAAVSVAVVGIGTLIGADLRGTPDSEFHTAWDAGQFTAFFGLFGAIALAVITSTADHTTGAIVPTLQWTPRRGVLFAARAGVTAGTATLLAVLLVTAASLVVAAIVPVLGLPWSDGAGTLGMVAAVCGCATLLGVGLGLVTRSTAAALVTSLALMLVLPLIMGNLPFAWATEVAERLPGSAALFLIFGGDFGALTTGSAYATLGAWALAGVVAGGWRLVRSDANR